MDEMFAKVWTKAALAVCLTLFAAQSFYTQSNWNAVKSGGASGDLVAVYFTSADRGFVAGDGGYLAQTNDGGKTWTKQSIGTIEDINEIYFRNDNNGYVVAGRKMFATGDGGRN